MVLHQWKDKYGLTETNDGWYKDHRLVIVEDNALRRGVTHLIHSSDTTGHPGVTKTLVLMNRNYWWPQMKHFTTEYIRGCVTCQLRKNITMRPKPPQYPIMTNPEAQPFKNIALDFITKLPLSKGYNSILTITDHDCSRQNISMAYHPQMDRQSERTNQWLEQYLRIFRNGAQTDWAKWLLLAQYTHNAWPSVAMGKAPFKLIMGHIPYAHIRKTHSLAPAINSRLPQTKAMRQAAQQAIMHVQQLMIRATRYKPFEEKQKVWLEATNLKMMHPTTKLSPRRYGLFKITKKLSHVVYQLHIPQQ